MITFRIRGTVRVAETGAGVPGLFVKAYDQDLLFDDLLGSAYTQADGRFEIVTTPEDFREFFEVKPDIYLKVFSPDGETLLYSSENAVRFRAGRLEEFDIRIPRDRLGSLAGESRVRLIDDTGQERETFDVGESLDVHITGLRPEAVYDLVLYDQDGAAIVANGVISNGRGEIEPTTLWPQLGCDDPRTDERLTFEEAQERWRGRGLRLEVRQNGRAVMEQTVRLGDSFTRPVLLGTDERGVVRNGFVAGDSDAVLSAYNLPFHGDVRVFLVARQHDWRPGNPFAAAQLASGRPAIADVRVESGNRRFRQRIAEAHELRPGAYDFVVRQIRYGYEDDEDLVLRPTDLVTRRITGLVVRQEFMQSKTVRGGCVNWLPISGRTIIGPPYFQYADAFQVGENVYAALDPAALDPNHKGKMVALYVVQSKDAATWTADKSLTHLAQLGGNPAVQKFLTQSDCINHNTRLVWPNANAPGLYDIVADFNDNAVLDSPGDIIDGYFAPGFRIVTDPTTETSFANHGGFQYDEMSQGSKTVTNDFGNPVTVPLKAVVRFPADMGGATMPGQISGAQLSYPMTIIVHGNGHDYQGYDYLLDHWAQNGFIAASIHLNGGMTGTDRALILFEHINILKGMFGGKAANNIGIMGHSRGGEGVVIAARKNQQMGLGHGINAVISLAPTDQYTHETLGPPWATPYLVIYGAMDGDLAGGDGPPSDTGFPLYDRANGQKKSFIFVYGATHDRFTTIGADTDLFWRKGPSDQPKILNAATHLLVAKGYATAFFRWQLRGEDQWVGMFRGEWVPTAVAQAEPAKLKICVQYSNTGASLIDDFEGVHTPLSWKVATSGAGVDDLGTLPAAPQEDKLYVVDGHSPHDTAGLQLRWDNFGDKLEYTLGALNVKNFAALSFRITQKVDSPSNPADQPQDLYVTLSDTMANSRSIKASKFTEIAAPQKRELNQYTKSALCTVRIPLSAYTIEVIGTQKVDLTSVAALRFDFLANATGEVEIDSVEFSN